MINGLILSFSPESLLIRIQDGKETILGTWLDKSADGKAVLIGQDQQKRIEVFMSFDVFENLKNDRFFQSKAGEFLKRIRTTPRDVLGRLLYSKYGEIDNDLDTQPAL